MKTEYRYYIPVFKYLAAAFDRCAASVTVFHCKKFGSISIRILQQKLVLVFKNSCIKMAVL